MAKTEALLDLINKFPEAFADPDFPFESPAFTPSEPDEEGATGETPQALVSPGLGSIESERGWCYHCLDQLANDPDLLKLAGGLLTQIADLATKRRHLAMAGDRIADDDAECGGVIEFAPTTAKAKAGAFVMAELPETFARQGAEGCPSGMCPVDH